MEELLIAPCGGKLVNLMVEDPERAELVAGAAALPSLTLSDRSLCDLELLATGAFSPLNTFLREADHDSVLDRMRLANGQLFPIPITLPVAKDSPITIGSDVALRDQRNELLAIMTVTEVYPWDREQTARQVFGTNDPRHPLVGEISGWGSLNISGPLRVLRTPIHHDFAELRLTPAQTRERLVSLGHANVVAFQTRNPLHRVHEELLRRAATAINGSILLHPAVGMTKPGDVDHYSRVRTYRVIAEKYLPEDRTLLSLIPLAMRMAGPREALWHALIRRNYGANHFIVGRDHAGPGVDSDGRPFYAPDEARELVEAHQEELGVKVVPFTEMVYLANEERYEERPLVKPADRVLSISGTEARADYLERGRPLPAWFTRPEVSRVLAETYLPRQRQGVCVWLTGLSCAGKSTIAEILTILLLAAGRRVTLLDGDVVRQTLSHGLGFSNEDRDRNIRRIGFVAAEVVRHGGVAICAAISPFRRTRDEVRALIGSENFVEVFVNTPLAVCEARDTKGLYAQARRGELSNFTGVNDPYEPPLEPDLALGDGLASANDNAHIILNKLVQLGFVEE